MAKLRILIAILVMMLCGIALAACKDTDEDENPPPLLPWGTYACNEAGGSVQMLEFGGHALPANVNTTVGANCKIEVMSSGHIDFSGFSTGSLKIESSADSALPHWPYAYSEETREVSFGINSLNKAYGVTGSMKYYEMTIQGTYNGTNTITLIVRFTQTDTFGGFIKDPANPQGFTQTFTFTKVNV